MKVIIQYCIILASLVGTNACTDEGETPKKDVALVFKTKTLAELPTVPLEVVAQPQKAKPEESITGFYQALAEQNCEKAQMLRPAYKISDCKNVEKITLNSTRIEFNNGERSAAYLNFTYVKNNVPHQFSGYLWLKNAGDHWEIQENFVPVDKMGLDNFIATYIGEGAAKQQEKIITAQTKDVINDDHSSLLLDLRKRFSGHDTSPVILVDVSSQKMFLYDQANKLKGSYPISTATKGTGNTSGSDQTPLGAHRISEKFGDNAALGAIFISRNNSGKVANIISEAIDLPEDHVTTRILWLDGLEPGKNKGAGVDSHSRYIYIHGTPEEGLIGKPASHGCIRMINKDVVKVFNQSPENTLVYIGK